jgi:hypothetical protein
MIRETAGLIRMDVLLERFAYSPDGTFGRIVAGKFECRTVERPWCGNAVGESCIPEGRYTMRKRASPVVERTSGYEQGWEVCDVPERTYIMIHVANWPDDVEGCIGPGREYRVMRGRNGVNFSQDTLDKLMEHLSADSEHTIHVTHFIPQYP